MKNKYIKPECEIFQLKGSEMMNDGSDITLTPNEEEYNGGGAARMRQEMEECFMLEDNKLW